MNELNIFLKALSNVIKGKRSTYIPRLTKKPSKFGAVKTYTLEVWCVDGEDRQLISSSSRTENIVSLEAETELRQLLVQETIENILKWYGLE